MSEEQDLYSDKNTKWRLRGTEVFVFHSPKKLVCIGILHYLSVFGQDARFFRGFVITITHR